MSQNKNTRLEGQIREFGRNVRKQRVLIGMTQERLAERAELNVRTVQKIEAGQVNVLITTAARIAGALRCGCEKLVTFH